MSTNAPQTRRRLVVIGCGPIGIELSLAALQSNCFDVTIVERGEPTQNVKDWGHVRLFSPNSLNTTALGLGVLDELNVPHPQLNIFPTGHEFVDVCVLCETFYFCHLVRLFLTSSFVPTFRIL